MTLATLWKYTEGSVKRCDILVNFWLSSAIKKLATENRQVLSKKSVNARSTFWATIFDVYIKRGDFQELNW